MDPLAINLIRTYVPVLVGAVVSYLAARGIHVAPDQTAWAVSAMTGVFTAAYYTVVRVLEERWPALGKVFLLSKPAASLHVAGACPAEAEDYGEDWPPPRTRQPVPAARPSAAAAPDGGVRQRRLPRPGAPGIPAAAGLAAAPDSAHGTGDGGGPAAGSRAAAGPQGGYRRDPCVPEAARPVESAAGSPFGGLGVRSPVRTRPLHRASSCLPEVTH